MNKISHQFTGTKKRKSLISLLDHDEKNMNEVNDNCCNHLCKTLPLICKNFAQH